VDRLISHERLMTIEKTAIVGKNLDEVLKTNAIGIKESTKIYRIFPLEVFLEIIQSKKLALAKPSTWEDPNENFLLNAIIHIEGGCDIHQNSVYYASCWTTQKECDGMWHRHGKNIGVKVSTTVRKLFSYLYDHNNPIPEMCYFIGKVDYLSDKKIKLFFEEASIGRMRDDSYHQEIRSLLIKRRAFKYESEVRLIFRVPDTTKPYEQLPLFCKLNNPWNFCDNLYKIKIDPNDIFNSVEFGPTIREEQYESLKAILKSIGYNREISRSKLFDQIHKYDIIWKPTI
jgi:hypothetical protein